MRWTGRRQSGNVEDRRGAGGGFSGGGLPGGMLSKGGIGVIIVILIISWLTGTNPLTLLQQTQSSGGYSTEQTINPPNTPAEDEMGQFVSVVLADTEDVWHKLMSNYREPTLVLFTGQV